MPHTGVAVAPHSDGSSVAVRRRFILLVAVFFLALAAAAAGQAHGQTVLYGNGTVDNTSSEAVDNGQAATTASLPGFVVVEGYVSEAPSIRDRPGVLIPIAGAQVSFIVNNTLLATTISNAVGFYSVALPADTGYTVVITKSGFEALIVQSDFLHTQSFNIGLTPVPFNGFVPYALYPVLETSPGRAVDCPIIVENFQVIDQMVTFTAVTGPDMQAWFPNGEAMIVRSGDSDETSFTLKYVGQQEGPQLVKVVVNGGDYFAEIPVVVVVKDLPFEEISFWSYSPEKVVKPGDTAQFIIEAENKYAVDKDLLLDVDQPDNWSVTTGNGSEMYIPDGKTGSSNLWVYVPTDAAPGNYTINLTLSGEGVKSNVLSLKVQVQSLPLFDAIIKGQNRTSDGYPELNLTAGQEFDMQVRVYNSWGFPLTIQASAMIGDNWPGHFVDIPPGGTFSVDPDRAVEFTIRSQVPADASGSYTARVFLGTTGQTMTLLAFISVPPKEEPPPATQSPSWEGIALAGATAATFAVTLAFSALRRLK